MEKIKSSLTPEWLNEKWEQWGVEWNEKYKKTKKSSGFRWRQYQNKGHKDLLEELLNISLYHCFFCDAYPMGMRLQCTIEHFRPKSKFPLLAYKWDNLFLSCRICQDKGDSFHEGLLKPDVESYKFDDYFDIVWSTGELIHNENASQEK